MGERRAPSVVAVPSGHRGVAVIFAALVAGHEAAIKGRNVRRVFARLWQFSIQHRVFAFARRAFGLCTFRMGQYGTVTISANDYGWGLVALLGKHESPRLVE